MVRLKPWKNNTIRIYSNNNRRYQGVSECWDGVHIKYKDIGGFTIKDHHFGNFHVNEEYRGKGYARRLFRQVKRLGKYLGYSYIDFDTTQELSRMYTRFGAVETGRNSNIINFRVYL